MKKAAAFLITGVLAASLIAGPLSAKTLADQPAGYEDLAYHWSPQVYQDVAADLGVREDYLTNFNYDGDWIGNNNWDNCNNAPEHAYVYYKVQETQTHYFIEYDFYHTRDDSYDPLDNHENDLEGMLVAVKKDGSQYGQLQVMETFAHNQWYQYTNDPSITSGSDNVDGGIRMNSSHPEVFIQANGFSPSGGHGVLAYEGSDAPGGDGIVYNGTGAADVPTDATGNYTHAYGYQLLSIDELWNRRYDVGGSGHTFDHYGVFDGDDYMPDEAKAPWAWDDSDDGPTYAGMNFSDPAHMIDTHLNGLGSFSHVYLYNPYYSYKVTINTVTSLANRDPFGGKSDIYAKITIGGDMYDQMDRLWKYDNSAVGVSRAVAWGADTATFAGQYSEPYNTLYLSCDAHNQQVTINVMDSDDGGDDDMGSVSCAPAPGSTVNFTNASTNSGQAALTASVTANAE